MKRSLALAGIFFAVPIVGSLGCGGAVAETADSGASSDAGIGADSGTHHGPDASGIDGSFPPFDSGSPTPFDASCNTPTIPLTRTPLYLLFAIDGSAHLSDATFGLLEKGVSRSIDAIAAEQRSELKVGLFVFGGSGDPSCGDAGAPCSGPYPGAADVPIALVDSAQQSQLKKRISSDISGGASDPMLAALTGGTKALSGVNGVNKALFLVTGGVPSDGTTKECVDVIGHAHSQDPSFTTAVLGIGSYPSTDTTQYDPSFLGQLALGGGTASPHCDPSANDADASAGGVCYAQVDPSGADQDLANAIFNARAAFECSFTIPPLVAPIDPALMNLVLGQGATETIVPQDPENGWTFDDLGAPTRVILHGSACLNDAKDPSAPASLITGCAVSFPNN